MSDRKCYLCKNQLNNPRQCNDCKTIFCMNCIYKYYSKKKLYCPNCFLSQRIDEYYPIHESEIDEEISSYSDFNPNKNFFCVECLKDFDNNEKQNHQDHHIYNIININQIHIKNLLKNINQINNFKNEINYNYYECKNQIEILNSIKKIKLDEIDNIKKIIESVYQNKYELLKKIESDFEKLLFNYNEYIKKSFEKIDDIIKNLQSSRLNDLLNKGVNKIKKYLNYINEDGIQLKELINKNNNTLIQSINFKSFKGENIETSQLNWNSQSINNTINRSIEINHNPGCKIYIFQTEKDRMNIRIDFTGNLHSKDKYYFTYLQMFNRKKNKILEIPIEFCKNNQIDKIITFEKIFENVDEFTKLIDEYYFELKLFFSELEIGNN